MIDKEFRIKIIYANLMKKISNKESFTNADKIRLMTNKELANFLNETGPYWTRDVWLNWLREDAPQA